jgi:hypothetical protein
LAEIVVLSINGVIYTGRDLTSEENLELMKYADSVIVKGVKSPERSKLLWSGNEDTNLKQRATN